MIFMVSKKKILEKLEKEDVNQLEEDRDIEKFEKITGENLEF